ncbi:MAG: YveK family protein [Oryzihumus sp.]
MTLTQLPGGGAVEDRPRNLLRAHAGLILAFTAVVGLGAAAYSHTQTPSYSSVARVMVEPQILPNGGAAPAPDMGTEKALALSSAVAAEAADTLQVSPSDASHGVDVAVPVDTHVLEFRATEATPEAAQRTADAFSTAYVDYRATVDSGSGRPVPQRAQVISPATEPTAPTGPSALLQVGAAVLLGLTLAIGAAALADRWDRRVRGAGRLATLTGSPVLAVLPRPRVKGARRLVLASSPESSVAESYRFLRTRVLDPMLPLGSTTVVVSCADDRDREARDVVAANLAAAAAENGCTVAVVTDPPSRSALEGLLGDGVPLLELYDAAGLGPSLHELSQTHDLVLVQAAPVTASAATIGALRQGDLAILVADTRLSDREAVRAAHRLAMEASVGPVWSLLTAGCSPRRAGVRRRDPRRRAVVSAEESRQLARVADEAGHKGVA